MGAETKPRARRLPSSSSSTSCKSPVLSHSKRSGKQKLFMVQLIGLRNGIDAASPLLTPPCCENMDGSC